MRSVHRRRRVTRMVLNSQDGSMSEDVVVPEIVVVRVDTVTLHDGDGDSLPGQSAVRRRIGQRINDALRRLDAGRVANRVVERTEGPRSLSHRAHAVLGYKDLEPVHRKKHEPRVVRIAPRWLDGLPLLTHPR